MFVATVFNNLFHFTEYLSPTSIFWKEKADELNENNRDFIGSDEWLKQIHSKGASIGLYNIYERLP
jgi:hypothetical protein